MIGCGGISAVLSLEMDESERVTKMTPKKLPHQ